jgi:hypothetical protein
MNNTEQRIPQPSRRKRSQRAFVMVGTMLVLMIVMAMMLTSNVSGIAGDSDNSLATVKRRARANMAQNLADVGMKMTMQWLAERSQAPDLTQAVAPSQSSAISDVAFTTTGFFGANIVSSGWTQIPLDQAPTIQQNGNAISKNGTLRVRLIPYTDNLSNSRKKFCIEAVGEYEGVTRINRSFIQQDTFARFAYFADVIPDDMAFSYATTQFQGPVHINAIQSTGSGISPGKLVMVWNEVDATKPMFSYQAANYFTTAFPLASLEGRFSNATTVALPGVGEWNKFAVRAQPPRTGQPSIVMPPTGVATQLAAALKGTAATSYGTENVRLVTTNPGLGSSMLGGIYVSTNVLDMNLSAANDPLFPTKKDIQILEIVFLPGTTTQSMFQVRIDPRNNRTTLTKYTRPKPFNNNRDYVAPYGWSVDTAFNTTGSQICTGLPNGVIYVEGTIGEQTSTRRGGISGVVANNYVGPTETIKNQLNIIASGNININGGIIYQNLQTVSSLVNPVAGPSGTSPNFFLPMPNTESGILGIVGNTIEIVNNDDFGNYLRFITIHACVMAFTSFQVQNADTRAPGTLYLIGGYVSRNAKKFGFFQGAAVSSGYLSERLYDSRLGDNPPPAFPATNRSYLLQSMEDDISTL